ncbi:hypothetical protein GCM10027577_01970 [Spirosoma fluminis]
MVLPAAVITGTGAAEERIPPVALVPYQFSVAPATGVAVSAVAGWFKHNVTGLVAGALGLSLTVTLMGILGLSQPPTVWLT